jgi:5-(carboxyamino)imidazole ribonucleotide mutase
VLSVHRTTMDVIEYARTARERGLRVIIAGAGGSAHLPGITASITTLPVIGVPVESKLQGWDSLLSIVQMPAGVPVATVAIGGGRNAGILAVQILATSDEALHQKVVAFKEQLAEQSRAKNQNLPNLLSGRAIVKDVPKGIPKTLFPAPHRARRGCLRAR